MRGTKKRNNRQNARKKTKADFLKCEVCLQAAARKPGLAQPRPLINSTISRPLALIHPVPMPTAEIECNGGPLPVIFELGALLECETHLSVHATSTVPCTTEATMHRQFTAETLAGHFTAQVHGKISNRYWRGRGFKSSACRGYFTALQQCAGATCICVRFRTCVRWFRYKSKETTASKQKAI